VGAGLDLVPVGLVGVGEVIVGLCGGGVGGRAEAEGGGGGIEEALLDRVEGALGEDVDAVDYVV